MVTPWHSVLFALALSFAAISMASPVTSQVKDQAENSFFSLPLDLDRINKPNKTCGTVHTKETRGLADAISKDILSKVSLEDRQSWIQYPRRYIKLLLIVENNIYVQHHGRNMNSLMKNIADVMNVVVTDFYELNIYVNLVGVVVWTYWNLADLTDKNNYWNNIQVYRDQYLRGYSYDHATVLISGSTPGFDGQGVVGLANMDAMCGGYSQSLALLYTETQYNATFTGHIIGHEIGHALGMPHEDGQQCYCNGECRMSSVIQDPNGPKIWSTCSRAVYANTQPKYTCMQTVKRFRIRSGFGSYLTLTSSLAGAAPVLGSKVSGSRAQLWYVAGDLTIRSTLNDLCITSPAFYPSVVTMQSCKDYRRDNKWVYNYSTKQIRLGMDSTKCLDVYHSNPALGTPMTTYYCYNPTTSNQKWILEDETTGAELPNIVIVS